MVKQTLVDCQIENIFHSAATFHVHIYVAYIGGPRGRRQRPLPAELQTIPLAKCGKIRPYTD